MVDIFINCDYVIPERLAQVDSGLERGEKSAKSPEKSPESPNFPHNSHGV